jgi:hypothetical protein
LSIQTVGGEYVLQPRTAEMFDDEADTISVDPALDVTKPVELRTDTFRDASPFEQVHDEIEDTDILVVSKLVEEPSITNVSVGRPGTNADWPPAPKKPAVRARRRASIYKAISSITKLTSLK